MMGRKDVWCWSVTVYVYTIGKQLSNIMCKDDIFIHSISILNTYSNNLPLYREDSSPVASCQACQEYQTGDSCVSSIRRYLLLKGKSHAVDYGSVFTIYSTASPTKILKIFHLRCMQLLLY